MESKNKNDTRLFPKPLENMDISGKVKEKDDSKIKFFRKEAAKGSRQSTKTCSHPIINEIKKFPRTKLDCDWAKGVWRR